MKKPGFNTYLWSVSPFGSMFKKCAWCTHFYPTQSLYYTTSHILITLPESTHLHHYAQPSLLSLLKVSTQMVIIVSNYCQH